MLNISPTDNPTYEATRRWMWVIIGVAGLIGLYAVANAFLPNDAHQVPESQGVTASPTTNGFTRLQHNFGELEPRARAEASLTLTNNSKTPWTLRRIYSDCGCLVHTVDWTTIDPGQSESLRVDFTAPSRGGSIRRMLRADFEENQAPSHLIEITATVRFWCRPFPDRITFTDVDSQVEDAAPTQTLILQLSDGYEIDATTPPKAPDWLNVDSVVIGDSGEPADSREVVYHLTPVVGADEGPEVLNDVVTFESSNHKESINVPVQMRLRRSMAATPRSVFLGSQRPGHVLTRHVRIQSPTFPDSVDEEFIAHAFTVEHDLGEFLHATLLPGSQQQEVLLQCRFEMPDVNRIISGRIRVTLAGNRFLTIPVSARIRSGDTE